MLTTTETLPLPGLIAAVGLGTFPLDHAMRRTASTSAQCALALVAGEYGAAPAPYDTAEAAWGRLSVPQRMLVTDWFKGRGRRDGEAGRPVSPPPCDGSVATAGLVAAYLDGHATGRAVAALEWEDFSDRSAGRPAWQAVGRTAWGLAYAALCVRGTADGRFEWELVEHGGEGHAYAWGDAATLDDARAAAVEAWEGMEGAR